MTSVSMAKPATIAGWSEAYAAPARPRPPYEGLIEALRGVDLRTLRAAADEGMRSAGATFGADPISICPIPRLIEAEVWTALAAGLAQRVRALSAFVVDVYGPREIVRAGIVPASVIEGAEGYEPELRGRWPEGHASLGVVGLDVVRDRDGEPRVLEDNARTPSGFSYAVAARLAVTATLGENVPGLEQAVPRPVPLQAAVVAALRATLADAAAAVRTRAPRPGNPSPVVVLTEGPRAAAYFEHARAARWLRAPLVTLAGLERRGQELWLRAGEHGPERRIDAVYRRTDTDKLYGEDGTLTPVAELLLEPWLAGRLALVNGFGTGVADDKLVHAYVERMIGFYLGEEPLIGSVETLDLNDPRALKQVLADLSSYVVKPRHGHGGEGVIVCARATEAEVRQVEEVLGRPGAGAEYIAQPIVALSLHPTVIGDELAERHIDLRPFAFTTREGVTVLPGGLTRVALDAGALVVNSSQGGGTKDTWVLP